MNAVGIDVSKGKSMVAIMRPFGEIVSTPFEIKHTSNDINSLSELINSDFENSGDVICVDRLELTLHAERNKIRQSEPCSFLHHTEVFVAY